MNKPLIPILAAIQQTRSRRVVEGEDIRHWHLAKYYDHGRALETNIRSLHIWIAENTTGRFYLSSKSVAFEDEKDFVLYKMGFGNTAGFRNDR